MSQNTDEPPGQPAAVLGCLQAPTKAPGHRCTQAFFIGSCSSQEWQSKALTPASWFGFVLVFIALIPDAGVLCFARK